MPLVAGGLAQQPMGYLADVMRVRHYSRAKEAVDREEWKDGELRYPAPAWAHLTVGPVLALVEEERALEMVAAEEARIARLEAALDAAEAAS